MGVIVVQYKVLGPRRGSSRHSQTAMVARRAAPSRRRRRRGQACCSGSPRAAQQQPGRQRRLVGAQPGRYCCQHGWLVAGRSWNRSGVPCTRARRGGGVVVAPRQQAGLLRRSCRWHANASASWVQGPSACGAAGSSSSGAGWSAPALPLTLGACKPAWIRTEADLRTHENNRAGHGRRSALGARCAGAVPPGCACCCCSSPASRRLDSACYTWLSWGKGSSRLWLDIR